MSGKCATGVFSLSAWQAAPCENIDKLARTLFIPRISRPRRPVGYGLVRIDTPDTDGATQVEKTSSGEAFSKGQVTSGKRANLNKWDVCDVMFFWRVFSDVYRAKI